MSIQLIVLVGLPFLLIYPALIFSYSYEKGFKEGFDSAEKYAEMRGEEHDECIPPVKPQEPFDIETYCKEHFVVMVDKDVWEKAEKALEQKPKTIQEIQAESEKYQKAFEDGYEQGYAQAKFDYEQEPCEDAISRQAVLSMQYRIDDSATLSTRDVVNVADIENLPPVKLQEPKTGHWAALEEWKNDPNVLF